MDHDHEIAKAKWLLGAGFLFLISGYFSFQELKYAVWGKEAEATVTKVKETVVSRDYKSEDVCLLVEYYFSEENGTPRSERDEVPIDWIVDEPTVQVQYRPGVPDSSRLVGNSNTVPVWIFMASVVILIVATYRLFRYASEQVHGKPPNRRFKR